MASDRAPGGAHLHAVQGRGTRARDHVPVTLRRFLAETARRRRPLRRRAWPPHGPALALLAGASIRQNDASASLLQAKEAVPSIVTHKPKRAPSRASSLPVRPTAPASTFAHGAIVRCNAGVVACWSRLARRRPACPLRQRHGPDPT